ncbi:DNA repair exonuclease [Desulfallas sp. Bu1-1]|uniref:metallophosphoesterase family protein n=1 Tax=Desulfallas sp. Bu1-1 TaxID=2787620 RepID=UPI0018A0A540|nr:DNA repair exonuclease [Desulfallas sp. Bu1-1]MBF7083416.1 DNA repair exonuclease [Desulfallas sp. Bu1-1]
MDGGFSFIHAADLHLDSPFRGFTRIDYGDENTVENVLRQLRDCTFKALDNIIGACIRHRVDFLVLAGDVYDLADRSLRAQLRLRDSFGRLAEAGISVFVAYGNHDHDDGFRAALAWPDNVHFFAAGEVEARPVVARGREVARVYGISYPRRDVPDNYASLFRREPGVPFAVAVLHCNVGGNAEHANYAPCSLDQLAGAGFDYWALGHVHSRAVLRERGPWVVYPGNPQGRNLRETGARGCYLVRVSPGGTVNLEFLETDCVRWERLRVPIDGLATEQELLDRLDKRLTGLGRLNGGRSLVVRLELTGRGPLHRRLGYGAALEGLLEELRNRFAGPTGPFVWPDCICRNTAALVDKETLRGSETLLGDLLTITRAARENGELRDRLLEVLAPLHDRAARHIDLPQGGEFDALLEAAGDLALDLLWEDETA